MLLTRAIAETLPSLGSQDGNPDAPVRLKVFDPCSTWTWYATEYDPQERLFFGLVVGLDEELGYFSLDELEAVRNRLGLPLERDLWWNCDTPLSAVVRGEKR